MKVVVNFRRTRFKPAPVTVPEDDEVMVSNHRDLGVELNSKLSGLDRPHGSTAHKWSKPPYFQRQLRSFSVCIALLYFFYHTVVSSALIFAVVFWRKDAGTGKTYIIFCWVSVCGESLWSELISSNTLRYTRISLHWSELTRSSNTLRYRYTSPEWLSFFVRGGLDADISSVVKLSSACSHCCGK